MKTALFTGQTGSIIPGSGDNSVELDSWDTPLGIGAEFDTTKRDSLEVVWQKADGSTWEQATALNEETGRYEPVILSRNRKVAVFITPGVYALRGLVNGIVTGYSITV